MFVDFPKMFNFLHRVKIEQILPAYNLSNETATAITIFCKNRKAMVRLPGGNSDFFDSVARFLQGDSLTPYMF